MAFEIEVAANEDDLSVQQEPQRAGKENKRSLSELLSEGTQTMINCDELTA